MEDKKLIEIYEQQFSNCTAEITSKITQLQAVSGYNRQNAILAIERLIDECKELLEQMELEIRGAGKDSRDIYQSRLKAYKAELDRQEKDFKQSVIVIGTEATNRDELFFNGSDVFVPDEQKQKLLDNSHKLERTGSKITGGYRTVLETEEIGKNILNDLGSQRETLQRSRNRVYEIDGNLGKSSRILSSENCRIVQNKILLVIVGIIMIGLIFCVLYLTIRRRS
ncbi:DgyrCDS6019 [Dimorphilus gyrociliatus]|uniref:DgyrCDS6019 n=1 Tax=Dimorphilus gyrociliatus TaxID=2664684 RepID=A0A7I8VLQ7_9ANNE|nr:DgyrCDS6019 [Dimorphilus gyrociliatus]